MADTSEFCTEAADLGAILLWAFLSLRNSVCGSIFMFYKWHSVYGSSCCNHRILLDMSSHSQLVLRSFTLIEAVSRRNKAIEVGCLDQIKIRQYKFLLSELLQVTMLVSFVHTCCWCDNLCACATPLVMWGRSLLEKLAFKLVITATLSCSRKAYRGVSIV